MVLRILQESAFLRQVYFNRWGKKWVVNKISHFSEILKSGSTILDIGCGNGLVTHSLRHRGFDVTPVDIEDLSFSDQVKPIIYNGSDLPFENKTFDTGLLLTVLHHSSHPETVLKEACRVCKHLIIIEDTFKNKGQKFLLVSADTFINLGYSKLEFSHKTDSEWKRTFNKLSIELVLEKHFKTLMIFNQSLYYVRCV